MSEPNTKTKRAQVVVNAEAAKYSAAVKLLAECVYCSVFTVERLKAKINKKLNAVAKHKRSGGTIVAALLNESSYGSDSNYVANSVVNQARHTLLYLSVSLSPSLPLSLSLSLSLSHTHTLSLSLSLNQARFLTALLVELDAAPAAVCAELDRLRTELFGASAQGSVDRLCVQVWRPHPITREPSSNAQPNKSRAGVEDTTPHMVQEEVLQHTQCTDTPQHTGAHHPI